MALPQQEFKVDPEQEIAPALKLLEEAGKITEDNRESVKAFLIQGIPHADKLALASIEFESLFKENYQKGMEKFLRIQDIKAFMIRHAEHAPECIQMLFMWIEKNSTWIVHIREFLSKDYTNELKTSFTENAPHGVPLALTKSQLKSASPLLQECLHEKYLLQHAQHSYKIFLAMKKLEQHGFLENQKNIPQIKDLLAKYGEYAYAFADAIICLGADKLLDPNSEFLTSEIMNTLSRCSPQYVHGFAIQIVFLARAGIFDQEHIELLLLDDNSIVSIGTTLQMLKKEDEINRKRAKENNEEYKEELFNKDNKLRLRRHANDIDSINDIMVLLSCSLGFNQNIFDMILKHADRFGKEMKQFLYTKRRDQAAFEKFLKEIDHQLELQKKPFLVCIKKADPTKGLGLFSKIDQTLVDKIYSFLPKPTPPKSP